VASILIVLQRSPCCLLHRTWQTEDQKYRLREQFLGIGGAIATQLHHLGHPTEMFDPKTGYPIFSQPGSLCLDDVAVVKACLGYPTNKTQACNTIIHPEWGNAVYPSVLLSAAPPAIVTQVIQSHTILDCGF
jgi:hypothetical protein